MLPAPSYRCPTREDMFSSKAAHCFKMTLAMLDPDIFTLSKSNTSQLGSFSGDSSNITFSSTTMHTQWQFINRKHTTITKAHKPDNQHKLFTFISVHSFIC